MSGWTATKLLALLAVLAGCGSPLRIEVAPSADRVRWEQQITSAVNDHETRLRALEAEHGRSDLAAQ